MLCARQFVPFARHTAEPFTKIAEALSVEPDALLKPNHPVEVAEPIIALFAFNEEIVLEVTSEFVKIAFEAKIFVAVTLVKVAVVPVND